MRSAQEKAVESTHNCEIALVWRGTLTDMQDQEDTTHIGVARAPEPSNTDSDAGSDIDRSAVKKHSNLKKQITASTEMGEDEEEEMFFHGDPSEREENGGDDGDEEKENLMWGRGVVLDFKRTVASHWCEEMSNFNGKTLPVSFFMFFAAVAPAITFGAVYEKSTHHWIGAVEMLAATAWVGIVYALIGGQPIMINGGTGPILAFSAVLYKLSETIEVPFLTFSAWCGLWVAVLNAIAAFIDLNRLILYATRFTDEIFALLISVIFIVNALGSPFSPVGLFYYFDEDHKSHDENEDDEGYSYNATALLSVVLCFGTTGLAMLLKGVKFSRYFFNAWTRGMLSDFSVTIAIFVFIIIDQVAFSSIDTEKLNVPDTFSPTFQCCTADCTKFWPDDCPDIEEAYGRRDWMVDLFDLNGKNWVPFFAVVPAFLAFILVFLDDGITLHLVNHPSHKLTHGDAYNLNTLLIGAMVGVNALFGFPWLVAATVRSLNHLHALADKDRDGKIVSVYETRLTNLIVHSMILGSIFMLPALKLIPVPVLYGVFLYMGVASLGTNEFWGRFCMYFMESSRYPETPYTKYVAPKSMHMYTAIQLFLFCTLYFVKSIKAIAIGFPVVIAICIPIRLYVLPKIFTPDELILLDGDEDQIVDYVDNAETEKRENEIETPLEADYDGDGKSSSPSESGSGANHVELSTL